MQSSPSSPLTPEDVLARLASIQAELNSFTDAIKNEGIRFSVSDSIVVRPTTSSTIVPTSDNGTTEVAPSTPRRRKRGRGIARPAEGLRAVDFLERALRGRRGPMHVKELADAVLAAGYGTTVPDDRFHLNVSAALSNYPRKFVRGDEKGTWMLRRQA